MSGFPPWSSTLYATLGGQRWSFHYDVGSGGLTATGEDGRAIGFAPAP